MLKAEEKMFLHDVANRIRDNGFFNRNDAIRLLRIVKRLDVAGEQVKLEFVKAMTNAKIYYERAH